MAEEWLGEVMGSETEAATLDLNAFLGHPAVRGLMDQLLGADGDGAAESPLGTLSFFAFHALRAGDIRLADVASVRKAAGVPTGDRLDVSWPRGAGYVQLPRNLVWMTPEPEARPDPVDGFFWFRPDDSEVSLLLVSGLIPGRPDMNVTLVQDAPLEDTRVWEVESMRDSGADFESTIPGGDQLYSLANLGEALKLAGRLLRLPTLQPPTTGPTAQSDPQGKAPDRSWLAYRSARSA